jgi:hypothetical protein
VDSEHSEPRSHLDNEISVVPFKFKHFPLLLDMLASQKYVGVAHITYETLPKIGYIALRNNAPVAAGFLRRLEGNMAHLDGLTSNAYMGSIVRNKGITDVVNTLISEAKSMGLIGIVATTNEKSVLERAESLGFQLIPQKVIALKF